MWRCMRFLNFFFFFFFELKIWSGPVPYSPTLILLKVHMYSIEIIKSANLGF